MKIYDNFNIFTSKLLDQRCKVEYVSDLLNIEFYTDGLLVWVSSINQFYVYSEQEDGWIPLPVVAPTSVLNPINGSIKFDPETKLTLTYYDGKWYDYMGREFGTVSAYPITTFSKVINPVTGETLQDELNKIFDKFASMNQDGGLVVEGGRYDGFSIITEDGKRIIG